MIDKKIKKQVMELSHHERAELAHLLIDSLHQQQDFVSEEAWSEELQKRIDRFEKGEAKTKSWEQVKKSCRSLLD
jgi:putative addiction module component (TIGR02574 family)